MYDESNVPGPEFKVRPVVRYIVTAYYHGYSYSSLDGKCCGVMPGSSEVIGEFHKEDRAEELAEALRCFHVKQLAAQLYAPPAIPESLPTQ